MGSLQSGVSVFNSPFSKTVELNWQRFLEVLVRKTSQMSRKAN